MHYMGENQKARNKSGSLPRPERPTNSGTRVLKLELTGTSLTNVFFSKYET